MIDFLFYSEDEELLSIYEQDRSNGHKAAVAFLNPGLLTVSLNILSGGVISSPEKLMVLD